MRVLLLPVTHQQQKQPADCLAACAAMALAYLRIPIEYSRLLRILEVNESGSFFGKLQNLHTLGLTVLIEHGDIDTLIQHLEQGLPPLIHVRTGELKSYWSVDTFHVVVLIGMDEQYVYLDDPYFATAPQRVPIDEFVLAWLEQDYLYAVIGLTDIDS
jgi:ABC-type bacteriocin/lantibiotic exporter with double-glycine peptidase domain